MNKDSVMKAQEREKFLVAIKEQEDKLSVENTPTLADAYQKLLYIDIEEGNQKFQEDEAAYFSFLDKVEMNDEMQRFLAQTMMHLGMQMKITWFRPLFAEFLKKIEEKGYLKASDYEKTIHSARCAYEAYDIHEDHKVTALVENYLAAVYKRTYTLLDIREEVEQQKIILLAANFEWYVTQYYREHTEEFANVEEKYPNTYALVADFIEEVKKDANAAGDACVEMILKYSSNVTDARELRMTLRKAYYKVESKNHETAFVQRGQTYKRAGEKVGRNDPCPCGSGKKFKQCCGRN